MRILPAASGCSADNRAQFSLLLGRVAMCERSTTGSVPGLERARISIDKVLRFCKAGCHVPPCPGSCQAPPWVPDIKQAAVVYRSTRGQGPIRVQLKRGLSGQSTPTGSLTLSELSAGLDPYWDMPPAEWLPTRTLVESLAGFGGSSAAGSGHLMLSPCGDIVPAFVAQSTVAATYGKTPSIGTGHPRNLPAPAAQMTGAQVHLCCSDIPTRRNERNTQGSTILRDGHGISIGSYGNKLNRVLDCQHEGGEA